jgi:nucleoside-diphosphate-sugar epimerase
MTEYLVTGGSGSVGSHLVESLEADGIHLAVPRSSAYDLTRESEVADLFAAEAPRVVYHLAAEVGGIGANRANPGRYWYSNLMMGVNVLEQAWIAGVEKVVMVGTICSSPKFAPIPFTAGGRHRRKAHRLALPAPKGAPMTAPTASAGNHYAHSKAPDHADATSANGNITVQAS